MSDSKPRSRLIFLCLVATWFIWGSTYLVIKFALQSFPPFFQMGTRFLVAGGMLLTWNLWHRRAMPTFLQWRNAAIIGGLMLGGGMGGTAYAEQSVASGLVVAFIAVVPAMIAAINFGFGIRLTKFEILGISIGVLGVILLVRGAGFHASPTGLIAIGLATLCWSSGSVLMLRLFPLALGGVGFASEMICGGVILILVSLLTHESVRWPPSMLAVYAWLYLVVFGSLIAFSAYMTLLSRTSTMLAASYSFVNPIIAMALGVSIGRENVTLREWFASAIIVAGVVLLLLGRAKKVVAAASDGGYRL